VVVEVETTAMAVGGAAVGRGPDGRVVFVEGALPGETVRAEVYDERDRYRRARAVDVLVAAPGRVAPPCPFVALGCGGCGWQHVEPALQRRLKAGMVSEALSRLGGVGTPRVEEVTGAGPFAYRTTVRLAVAPGGARPGGAAFRAGRSHSLVEVDDCLVAHPRIASAIAASRFGRADQAVLRVGARTGEGLALLTPDARGARVAGGFEVVGADELGRGRSVAYHEVVAGCRLRVSAGSFFQSSPEGAEALVREVRSALAGAGPGLLVDAYAGVGLFGAATGWSGRVVAVESSPSSVADARVNVVGAEVVLADVGRWAPRPAAAVVADPPRHGLGRGAAEVLAATLAPVLVLVSCDVGALGRDAGLLEGHGFRLDRTVVVDLFPGTPRVEAVSLFRR
jgi:tRNA/tmRNA/rRNA uracil-C5-methylase (TrmA/RlmC/RlmD family)